MLHTMNPQTRKHRKPYLINPMYKYHQRSPPPQAATPHLPMYKPRSKSHHNPIALSHRHPLSQIFSYLPSPTYPSYNQASAPPSVPFAPSYLNRASTFFSWNFPLALLTHYVLNPSLIKRHMRLMFLIIIK